MKKQILKVGFDLDGVLLYNPTRIARPFIVFIKRLFFNDEVDKFHFPDTKFQQFIWSILHKSSLYIVPAYQDIKKLIVDKKIEAYIISARYDFLEDDFKKWIKKIDGKSYFKDFYINLNNEQPYVFKKKVIKNLGLDVFVEDNWDIIKKISTLNNGVKIFWITNIFDCLINYKYKFFNLKRAVEKIKKLI